jgi:hypothetical protein
MNTDNVMDYSERVEIEMSSDSETDLEARRRNTLEIFPTQTSVDLLYDLM